MNIATAFGVLLALVAGSEKPDARTTIRPALVESIEVVELAGVAVSTDYQTTFECMDLGAFPDPCWVKEGVQVCAAAVGSSLAIVEPTWWGMGERSLGWSEKCISDERPVIRLEFDVPLAAVNLVVGGDPAATEEYRYATCWMGPDRESMADPDPSWGFTIVPPQGHAITAAWSFGMGVSCSSGGQPCGVLVCDIGGPMLDNIFTTVVPALMTSTGK